MDDTDVAAEALTLNPNRSEIVLFFGAKGRGKSAGARALFDGWPFDRGVIDPTGNARPDDPTTRAMVAPFPSQLPDPDPDRGERGRVTVWARIDPASSTFNHDQDAATGMLMHPRSRRVCIWRDEFGLGTSAHQMAPNDRTLLMSSRHFNATALLVCPRPRHIPTLALSQADKILVWSVPNRRDREHIADNVGVSAALFERQYADNQRRSPHAFLLYDRATDALINCPPLPNIRARGPAA